MQSVDIVECRLSTTIMTSDHSESDFGPVYYFFPFGATAPILALAYLYETFHFTSVY
jgi:hypothetical protein